MADNYYSIIIPVYNRPDEVRELLDSLLHQSYTRFEVIIVEDGSEITAEQEVNAFAGKLDIQYFKKPNEGPGPTRNFGAARAKGNYLIFFDSDCLIPAHYMQAVEDALLAQPLDVFGGPDAAHPSFTPIQKAISYSMTSFFTTGGIRGGMKDASKFHPRSFNMGFRADVFKAVGGYADMRFGEDLDMSMRLKEAKYRSGLIRNAFVYHKRRTDLRKFFKQVHNSGIARINLHKRHPGTLKPMHAAPAAFVLFSIFSLLALFAGCWYFAAFLLLYLLLVFADAAMQNKSLLIGWLSVEATVTQHWGYGTGFIKAFWKRILLGQPEFHSYRKNFYK